MTQRAIYAALAAAIAIAGCTEDGEPKFQIVKPPEKVNVGQRFKLTVESADKERPSQVQGYQWRPTPECVTLEPDNAQSIEVHVDPVCPADSIAIDVLVTSADITVVSNTATISVIRASEPPVSPTADAAIPSAIPSAVSSARHAPPDAPRVVKLVSPEVAPPERPRHSTTAAVPAVQPTTGPIHPMPTWYPPKDFPSASSSPSKTPGS